MTFDGGKEFLADAVTRAAGEVGFAGLPAPPYSPHLKGKVERFHRTLNEGLMASLPHYTGGARKANGELYAQPRPLTFEELQAEVRGFIDGYNHKRVHSSLHGLTPAEKWDMSRSPLDTVDPVHLRWMLLADKTRKITTSGISFKGDFFIAKEIWDMRGETVEIRYMPHDQRQIEVFTEQGWLCTAYPQHMLSAEESAENVGHRRAGYAEMGRTRAAATRRRKKDRVAPVTPTGPIEDITQVTRKAQRGAKDKRIDRVLRSLRLDQELNTANPPSEETEK